MQFIKLMVKLKSTEYRNETTNIVLGGARFSVFPMVSDFSKEG